MDAIANIGFDWQIALSNFVTFIVIVWVLSRYVFKPIGKIIDARNAEIQDGLDKAQQSETELLVAQQQAEETLKSARSEANDIVAHAKQHADEQRAHTQQQAENDASAILDKAHNQIEKDKVRMEKELLEQTAGLVALGVQKILHEDVTSERNQEVSERALELLNKK